MNKGFIDMVYKVMYIHSTSGIFSQPLLLGLWLLAAIFVKIVQLLPQILDRPLQATCLLHQRRVDLLQVLHLPEQVPIGGNHSPEFYPRLS